jgi:hypothetical protein
LRWGHKRRAQHQNKSSKGKAGETRRTRATIQKRRIKIFAAYHDEQKLFQPSTAIFAQTKRKTEKQWKILFDIDLLYQ